MAANATYVNELFNIKNNINNVNAPFAIDKNPLYTGPDL